MDHTKYLSERCTIIVIGASGDLSIRKVIPALFSIFCLDLMPKEFHVVGYARSKMTDAEFFDRISPTLSSSHVSDDECSGYREKFLSHCSYVSGQYDSSDDFNRLREHTENIEGGKLSNRVFYMAIPPSVFLDTAKSIGEAGFIVENNDAWERVVIEKPFGHDGASSKELSEGLSEIFSEKQTYRIDHYLGKEVIQNLMVLRFANHIFEPLWNHSYIRHVEISWAEDFGIEGRAGYFDQYGILRDVMQNHLMQMMALVAMEPPVSLEASDIGDEKVKLLRCVQPLDTQDICLGQYGEVENKEWSHCSYLQEEGVPDRSRTETYVAAALQINNRRWHGVPFFVRAGKALNARTTEIRVVFRQTPGNIFKDLTGPLDHNELVIRVQPNETIYFKVVNKVPGLPLELDQSNLDMSYKDTFRERIPDAYERLILDVLRGDKSLFIRNDELVASWAIYDQVLKDLDKVPHRPEIYPYQSRGPIGADALTSRYGATWSPLSRNND